jgi:release factor glutamine methyltransferase
MDPALDVRQRALVSLGRALREGGYRFVTPTPETIRRVNARAANAQARNLRDVFGWSRPFARALLPAAVLQLGEEAGVLSPCGSASPAAAPGSEWLKSTVRFATVPSPSGELILVHSAYPTLESDAVFFGPDSYRFAALLARTVWKARRLVDVGCGTGIGGLALAARADEVVLADVNPSALRLAAVNVALAQRDGGAVSLATSDVLKQIDGGFDALVANPPYLVDDPGRVYRDGGGGLGIDLSVRIVTEGLERLGRGGQLVLYTGSPIVDGGSVLQAALAPVLSRRAASFQWEELDPDVFGEELERPAYQTTDRIAVVALTAIAG